MLLCNAHYFLLLKHCACLILGILANRLRLAFGVADKLVACGHKALCLGKLDGNARFDLV